jgi:hypothetical protein
MTEAVKFIMAHTSSRMMVTMIGPLRFKRETSACTAWITVSPRLGYMHSGGKCCNMQDIKAKTMDHRKNRKVFFRKF